MKKLLLFLGLFLALFSAQGQSVRDYSTKDIADYNIWLRPIKNELKISGQNVSPNQFLGNIHVDTLTKTVANRIFSVSNLNNTSDLNKPISNFQQTALNGKQQTVSSIAELVFYAGSNYAYFDGNNWEKKGGNVPSNGGSYAGTIINISSNFYWERKINSLSYT